MNIRYIFSKPEELEPKFCSFCGERLVKGVTCKEYDIYTGKPKKREVTYYCPNKSDEKDEHFQLSEIK